MFHPLLPSAATVKKDQIDDTSERWLAIKNQLYFNFSLLGSHSHFKTSLFLFLASPFRLYRPRWVYVLLEFVDKNGKTTTLGFEPNAGHFINDKELIINGSIEFSFSSSHSSNGMSLVLNSSGFHFNVLLMIYSFMWRRLISSIHEGHWFHYNNWWNVETIKYNHNDGASS